MPQWFPWIFIGGVIFIALSFIGAKYRGNSYRNIQYLQDFISGAILIAFTGVLMPDLFSAFNLPSLPSLPSIPGISDGSDVDLQVGPPRLVGR